MAVVEYVGAEEVSGIDVWVLDEIEHHLCENVRWKRAAMLQYWCPCFVW